MNPGKLNKKITIERPVSIANGQGGRVKTWEPVCETWASFKAPKLQVDIVQGGLASVIMHEITIRACDGVSPGCRVVEGDGTYRVTGIWIRDKRYMALICKEVDRFGD